ncbi:alpha 1,2-mannosyltransferase 2.4.1 [Apophysomyces ossiformis]|uniref:Alpha 1,2-mannosyltransferase 2.4.1 n=1 Tax=Apophysomyces ossiformis TaxID=679940 RepID=A0A8H7BSF4_9FUNG|nr:alpha 1,2-mannosyltransferase 2.4.1 [Apophysomyces ossiformis]
MRISSSEFSGQPSSYTLGPRDNPQQMIVSLPPPTNTTERVHAGFIVLVRNSELYGMLSSMRDIEDRFNHKFGYPWIFLNDEPFTEEFKGRTTAITCGKTYYGLVDKSMWSYPSWIDLNKTAEAREKMAVLPYGDSESYRHMCRFQSGFFWRHPLVLELGWEYYWRVEPDVRYYCELDYDPFLYMKQNNKQYAFTISFIENRDTIPTLWSAVRDFVQHNPGHFANQVSDSLYEFVTTDGEIYNQCHFWTNFEIARLDLWHTDAYRSFFAHLDSLGGFYYERWGDAPIHSIFVALYLRKDEVHFFNDIGYKHSTYEHCPEQDNLLRRCYCNPANTLDYTDPMSCLNTYMKAMRGPDQRQQRTVAEIFK